DGKGSRVPVWLFRDPRSRVSACLRRQSCGQPEFAFEAAVSRGYCCSLQSPAGANPKAQAPNRKRPVVTVVRPRAPTPTPGPATAREEPRKVLPAIPETRAPRVLEEAAARPGPAAACRWAAVRPPVGAFL